MASLAAGQTATLTADTLRYEWDQDIDNGFRPAGLIDMSATTQTPPDVMIGWQEALTALTITHHLTLYRALSGALVFGAGTVQWSWGLDTDHDGAQPATTTAMQQATVNILADMHAQPPTLISGLTAVPASTDTTPPGSTITSPTSGTNLADGASVTVTGARPTAAAAWSRGRHRPRVRAIQCGDPVGERIPHHQRRVRERSRAVDGERHDGDPDRADRQPAYRLAGCARR